MKRKTELCKGKLKKYGKEYDQKVASCFGRPRSWVEKWQRYKCCKCGDDQGYRVASVERLHERKYGFVCYKMYTVK